MVTDLKIVALLADCDGGTNELIGGVTELCYKSGIDRGCSRNVLLGCNWKWGCKTRGSWGSMQISNTGPWIRKRRI